MATFLDVGLVEHFAVIFPVLLVFVTVFAVLQKSKMFGENKGLHSIVALSIAMMVLLSRGVIEVIAFMAPWFVLIFIFLLLLIIGFKFLGVSDQSITGVMSKWGVIHWFLLVIFLIVFVGALGSVYGQSFLPYSGENGTAVVDGDTATSTGDFNSNVGRTIFHPKVIGMVFVLMVGSFTIRLLCGKTQ